MESIKTITRQVAAALGIALAVAGGAQAQTTIGTTFPTTLGQGGVSFMNLGDASTSRPWIGFGAAGPVTRTPVIILHGNDGTPFDTGCGRFSMRVRDFAQYLDDQGGYSPSELWALGWQGDQCDQNQTNSFGVQSGWTESAGAKHTITANVPDLSNFVDQVMRYTGASRVDIVAHDTGVILAREWVRQATARKLVRRFVAIDGPNAGMAICSKNDQNSWALAFSGGFTPTSPLCYELGSPNTPFLKLLNKAADGARISASDTLVIRNGDSSFLFFPRADGAIVQGAPALNATGNSVYDSYGVGTDFTSSASIKGGQEIALTGQHGWDVNSGTAHVGIANSPLTWQAALSFLMRK